MTPEQELQLGYKKFNEHDYKSAFEHWKEALEGGCIEAQDAIDNAHCWGIGEDTIYIPYEPSEKEKEMAPIHDLCWKIWEYIQENKYNDHILDYLQVIFALYAVKEQINLLFEEGKLIGVGENIDDIGTRLLNLCIAIHLPEYDFSDIEELYYEMREVPHKLFKKAYPIFIEELFKETEPYNESTSTKPSNDIADTVHEIIKSKGCTSVFNPHAGLGSLAVKLSNDIYYCCHDKSCINALLSTIYQDAFGRNNIKTLNSIAFDWEYGFDAIISIPQLEKDDFDNPIEGLVSLISNSIKYANKLVITLVNYDFCTHNSDRNYKELYDLKRFLCENRMIDMVIEFYDRGSCSVFSDITYRTALLVLDPRGGVDEVTFVDPSKYIDICFLKKESILKQSKKIKVSYEEITENNFCLVSALYNQKPTIEEGKKLIKLRDVLRYDYGKPVINGTFEIATAEDFSSNLLQALNVPRRHIEADLENDIYCEHFGPHLYLRFDNQLKLFVVKNDDNFCITDDGYAYFVNEDIVDIEYLAFVLLKDKNINNFIKGVFGRDFYNLLLNYTISIYEDKEKQKVELSKAVRKEEARLKSYKEHNIVWAGINTKTEELELKSLYNLNISYNSQSLLGEDGLLATLNKEVNENIFSKENIKAIIIDEILPISVSNNKNSIFRVIGEYIRLQNIGFKIPLYIFSNNVESFLESVEGHYDISELSFLKGRVFSSEDYHTALKEIREELDRKDLPQNRLQDEFFNSYTTAKWFDQKYPYNKLGDKYAFSMVSVIASAVYETPDVNTLRNAFHRIVDMLQQRNIVPKALDYGAVPSLILDGAFRDNSKDATYRMNNNIFPKALTLSLWYFKSIANPGTHGVANSANIWNALLNILHETMDWIYHNIINDKVTGRGKADLYWTNAKVNEVPLREPLVVQSFEAEDGEEYFFCGNYEIGHIHLGDIKKEIKQGDIVRLKKVEFELKPRYRDGIRIIFYSRHYEITEQ